MKIQSNVIAYTQTLRNALESAGISGVYVDVRSAGNGRGVQFSYDVTLHAEAGNDAEGQKRRRKNSGNYGADRSYAATYREHGWWMKELFAIDPAARISYYHGVGDFHAQTRNEFYSTRTEAIAARG